MKSDMNTIEELIKILNDKKLTDISLETSDIKIRIKGTPTQEKEIKKEIKKENDVKNLEVDRSRDILSEHIGVFKYLRKDGTPRFEVGQEIKEGQELGNVIAVGVALPVTAKFSGTVEEIYVENGEIVDYGKPLIKVMV